MFCVCARFAGRLPVLVKCRYGLAPSIYGLVYRWGYPHGGSSDLLQRVHVAHVLAPPRILHVSHHPLLIVLTAFSFCWAGGSYGAGTSHASIVFVVGLNGGCTVRSVVPSIWFRSCMPT